MSQQEEQEEADAAAAKPDPLDFDATKLASHIREWSLDSKNQKTVKTRDREEIDLLHRLTKYEQHFNDEDKKAFRKRLRFFYLVSDLNWNAAINDLREVEREDLGIVISSRTAAICPWKRGRGDRAANR